MAAKRQPGRRLQVDTLYSYRGAPVVPDAACPVATQAFEKPRLEASQKIQTARRQKGHSCQSMIHVELKPFVASAAFKPPFELADPAPRFGGSG
jgi:hypothetical protein